MTRFAYIWVLGWVALAFWFHAHEESERTREIEAATKHALYVGIREGCERDNRLGLVDANCHREALRAVEAYLQKR